MFVEVEGKLPEFGSLLLPCGLGGNHSPAEPSH